jgi:anaerobic selenocysteine-containing dehydrogenase
VALWTGISAHDIVKLARQYATTRPTAIRLNYGVQRSENGGMAVRAVCMLPCLVGAWKQVGGGLQLSTSEGHNLNKNALKGAELMPRPARVINMVELGRALSQLNDPPVKALFVYNSNPAAVAPNHNSVVRGLLRTDLFTVVHEQFFTDTTDYADIILPATTFFEHKDLQTGYGHYYIQISNQAIEPLGECRSNVELFRALALGMGFGDACFRESVDDMIDLALSSDHPHLAGIDRARLQRESHVRLNFSQYATVAQSSGDVILSEPAPGLRGRVEGPLPSTRFYLPFASGFSTRTGKALLYNQELAAQGLDPVASFTPPKESRHSGDARYPLELLARKCDNYLNSTFANLPPQQKMENPDLLEISAADAEARGIADGDRVRVFNSRGEILLTARVNGATRPGVVAARLNWAKLTGQARNINVLTSERLTDMGGGGTFYSVLVEVARAAR